MGCPGAHGSLRVCRGVCRCVCRRASCACLREHTCAVTHMYINVHVHLHRLCLGSTCTAGLLPGIRSELLGAPVGGWMAAVLGNFPGPAAMQGETSQVAGLAAPNSAGVGLGVSWRNGALCPEELLLFSVSLWKSAGEEIEGGRGATQMWACGWEPGQHRGPVSSYQDQGLDCVKSGA